MVEIVFSRFCLSDIAQRGLVLFSESSLSQLLCSLNGRDIVGFLVFCESRLASGSSPSESSLGEQCLISCRV